jgi:hypothetical protein
LTEDFYSINILSWEASRDQEVNEEGHEAQTGTCGVGPQPDHATKPSFVLGPPMPSVFISDWSSWPKNSYIKTPLGVPSRRWQRNTKQRLFQRRLKGETLPELPPVTSPTSPTSPTPPPWWRGSSTPLYYGFMAVACSISLLCYDV